MAELPEIRLGRGLTDEKTLFSRVRAVRQAVGIRATRVATKMSDEAESEKEGRDRRSYTRSPVLWTGSLISADRTVDCVIMNASANGAKVRMSEAIPLSSPITLEIPRLGAFKAEIVWTKENKIGVRFLESPAKVAQLMVQILPQTDIAS